VIESFFRSSQAHNSPSSERRRTISSRVASDRLSIRAKSSFCSMICLAFPLTRVNMVLNIFTNVNISRRKAATDMKGFSRLISPWFDHPPKDTQFSSGRRSSPVFAWLEHFIGTPLKSIDIVIEPIVAPTAKELFRLAQLPLYFEFLLEMKSLRRRVSCESAKINWLPIRKSLISGRLLILLQGYQPHFLPLSLLSLYHKCHNSCSPEPSFLI